MTVPLKSRPSHYTLFWHLSIYFGIYHVLSYSNRKISIYWCFHSYSYVTVARSQHLLCLIIDKRFQVFQLIFTMQVIKWCTQFLLLSTGSYQGKFFRSLWKISFYKIKLTRNLTSNTKLLSHFKWHLYLLLLQQPVFYN